MDRTDLAKDVLKKMHSEGLAFRPARKMLRNAGFKIPRIWDKGREELMRFLQEHCLAQKGLLPHPLETIVQFLREGDGRGPLGFLQQMGWSPDQKFFGKSEVVVVGRPISDNAITLMRKGLAKGKPYPIKGKSSKEEGILGFVPFVQIDNHDHAQQLRTPPSEDLRVNILCKTIEAAQSLQQRFESKGEAAQHEPHDCAIHRLIVSEAALRRVMLQEGELMPPQGLGTGRPSNVKLMEANLVALRDIRVCLHFHADGPHGLLMAYDGVPVCSDLDFLLIATKGINIPELPSAQQELRNWCAAKVEEVGEKPGSWADRWQQMLQSCGGAPSCPESFGCSDVTTAVLIQALIAVTAKTGLVQHGCESHNYTAPQEVDDQGLIWISETGWSRISKDELFLKLAEGNFEFAMNPAWPAMDRRWAKFRNSPHKRQRCGGS